MKRMQAVISGILLFTVVFPLMSMYSPALEQAMNEEANQGTTGDFDDQDASPDTTAEENSENASSTEQTAAQESPAQQSSEQVTSQLVSSTPVSPTQVSTPLPLVTAPRPMPAPVAQVPMATMQPPAAQPQVAQTPPAQSAIEQPAMAQAPMVLQPVGSLPEQPARRGVPLMMNVTPVQHGIMAGPEQQPVGIVPVQPTEQINYPVAQGQPTAPAAPVIPSGQGGVHAVTQPWGEHHHGHGPQVATLPAFSRSSAQAHYFPQMEQNAWQGRPMPRHEFKDNSRAAYRRRRRNKKSKDNTVIVQNQNTELPPIASFRVPDPEDRVTPNSEQVYAMEQQQIPNGDLTIPMPTYPCQHMGNMPNDLSLSQQLDWLIADGCTQSLNEAQRLLDTSGRKKYIRYILRKIQARIDAARAVVNSTVPQR